MSASTATGGGIRNLLAMFENKTTDPPTSPSKRDQLSSQSDTPSSSKLLNKVRTQFIPVGKQGTPEKPLVNGLAKTEVVNGAAALNEDSSKTVSTPAVENSATAPTMAAKHAPKESIDGGLGTILKGSAFEAGSAAAAEDTAKKPNQNMNISVIEKKPSSAVQPSQNTSKSSTTARKTEVNKNKPQVDPQAIKKSTTTDLSIKTKPDSTPNPKATSPSPTESKRNTRAPISLTGSAVQHIKGGPAKIKGVMESAARAREARESLAKKADPDVKKETDLASTAKVNGTKKNSSISSSITAKPGNVKKETNGLSAPITAKPQHAKKDVTASPNPTSRSTVKKDTTVSPTSLTAAKSKSPAKLSGRLPSAATASTAASAARMESHASQSESPKVIPKRSSTLTLRSAKPSSVNPTASVGKKASRASLNPGVTGKTNSERPKSRVSTSQADESFLARMTRPTASSSQKTHEKLQVTSPPRSRNVSGTHTNIKPSVVSAGIPVNMKAKFPRKADQKEQSKPEESDDKEKVEEEADPSQGIPDSSLETVKEDPFTNVPTTPSISGTTAIEPTSSNANADGGLITGDLLPTSEEHQIPLSSKQVDVARDQSESMTKKDHPSENIQTPSKQQPPKVTTPLKAATPEQLKSPPKLATPGKAVTPIKQSTPEVSASPTV